MGIQSLEVAKARLADAEAAERRARSAVEMRRVELAELERKAAESKYPERPKGSFFRVSVQYHQADRIYNYALVRVGDTFYTTGRGEDGLFTSWRRLVDWLRAAHWNSGVIELEDAPGRVDVS